MFARYWVEIYLCIQKIRNSSLLAGQLFFFLSDKYIHSLRIIHKFTNYLESIFRPFARAQNGHIFAINFNLNFNSTRSEIFTSANHHKWNNSSAGENPFIDTRQFSLSLFLIRDNLFDLVFSPSQFLCTLLVHSICERPPPQKKKLTRKRAKKWRMRGRKHRKRNKFVIHYKEITFLYCCFCSAVCVCVCITIIKLNKLLLSTKEKTKWLRNGWSRGSVSEKERKKLITTKSKRDYIAKEYVLILYIHATI